MAAASGTSLRFTLENIPLYPEAARLATEWCFPGGGFDNAEFFGPILAAYLNRLFRVMAMYVSKWNTD